TAAKKGNASLFGSGTFPGFANFIAAVMATQSRDFQRIRFLESVDLTNYEAFANFGMLGWGQPPDEKWVEINRAALGTYIECIDVIADLLGIPVTEKLFHCEFAVAPDDREFFGFSVPAGTISGQKSTWSGMVGDKQVIELEVVWKAGDNLKPDWPLFHGYVMEIKGNPDIRTKVSYYPSKSNPEDPSAKGAGLANIVTAMPVINAIPA
ncbi:MAG: hypothetical protein GY850_40880, partial [bacterium]|nr:hypothetical protein [bacterium]